MRGYPSRAGFLGVFAASAAERARCPSSLPHSLPQLLSSPPCSSSAHYALRGHWICARSMPTQSAAHMEPAYEQQLLAAIAAQEQSLAQLQAQLHDLQSVCSTVDELPRKLKQDVMVPLGQHAFFPGQLVHTNELVVHLGGEHYAEMTAADARQVLQRRADRLAQEQQGCEQRLATLQTALLVARGGVGVADDDEGGGKLLEIRESVEESDAMLVAAAVRGGPHASHGAHGARVRAVVGGDDTAAARDAGGGVGCRSGGGDGAGSSGRSSDRSDADWDAWSAEVFARYERAEEEAEAAEAAEAAAGTTGAAGAESGGRLEPLPQILEGGEEEQGAEQQEQSAARRAGVSTSGQSSSAAAAPGFKRGFLLGGPSKAKAAGAAGKASAAAAGAAAAAAGRRQPAASEPSEVRYGDRNGVSSSSQQQQQQQQQEGAAAAALRAADEAFAAQVVERPVGLQQPGPATFSTAQAGTVPAGQQGGTEEPEEQPQRRVSKFKQQRMMAASS